MWDLSRPILRMRPSRWKRRGAVPVVARILRAKNRLAALGDFLRFGVLDSGDKVD